MKAYQYSAPEHLFLHSRQPEQRRYGKLLCAFANCSDFGNWLDSTDFIVCIHNRYNSCIFSDSVFYIFGMNNTVFVHIKVSYLKTLFFKSLACVKNSVMLKLRSDDVFLPFALRALQTPFNAQLSDSLPPEVKYISLALAAPRFLLYFLLSFQEFPWLYRLFCKGLTGCRSTR